MKFDPQIPIGKAMDKERGDDDDEVMGHGLIFDTGAPAISGTSEQAVPGRDDVPEEERQQLVPDKE